MLGTIPRMGQQSSKELRTLSRKIATLSKNIWEELAELYANSELRLMKFAKYAGQDSKDGLAELKGAQNSFLQDCHNQQKKIRR